MENVNALMGMKDILMELVFLNVVPFKSELSIDVIVLMGILRMMLAHASLSIVLQALLGIRPEGIVFPSAKLTKST